MSGCVMVGGIAGQLILATIDNKKVRDEDIAVVDSDDVQEYDVPVTDVEIMAEDEDFVWKGQDPLGIRWVDKHIPGIEQLFTKSAKSSYIFTVPSGWDLFLYKEVCSSTSPFTRFTTLSPLGWILTTVPSLNFITSSPSVEIVFVEHFP